MACAVGGQAQSSLAYLPQSSFQGSACAFHANLASQKRNRASLARLQPLLISRSSDDPPSQCRLLQGCARLGRARGRGELRRAQLITWNSRIWELENAHKQERMNAPLPRSVRLLLLLLLLLPGGEQRFSWGWSHARAVHSFSLNHVSLHSHSCRGRLAWRSAAPERAISHRDPLAPAWLRPWIDGVA